jgi:hypothetical protein
VCVRVFVCVSNPCFAAWRMASLAGPHATSAHHLCACCGVNKVLVKTSWLRSAARIAESDGQSVSPLSAPTSSNHKVSKQAQLRRSGRERPQFPVAGLPVMQACARGWSGIEPGSLSLSLCLTIAPVRCAVHHCDVDHWGFSL